MDARLGCLLMGTWVPVSWLGQSDAEGKEAEGEVRRGQDRSQLVRGEGKRPRVLEWVIWNR